MNRARSIRFGTSLKRSYSTRPHPLATASSPSPAVAQKWSTAVLISLATLVGASTYLVGLTSQSPLSLETSKDAQKPRGPTSKGFASAMKEVEGFLLKENYSTERDNLVDHGYSVWSYHDAKALPGAVLYPRSTEDVVRIVKLAALHAIPIIPYAGGTSLEGHFSAPSCHTNPAEMVATELAKKNEKIPIELLAPGLSWCVDFAEMGAIIKVNAGDLDIVVQPGISYDAINATLKEQGIPLFFPVDPAPGAQIGGMIGTGASGTNAVKYGTMRENVLNVTVVLPNGDVIKTRSRAKKSSVGPDLTKLFVGAEGTLGLVVEATLKLQPVAPTSVAVMAFDSVEAAADCVRDVIQAGISVACIELLDDVMLSAINKRNKGDGAGGGRVWDEKPSLFLKFSGSDSRIKNDVDEVRRIAGKYSKSKFIFAKNEMDAEEIWYSRKIALYSAMDLVPGSRCWTTDVCVPLQSLPELIAETKKDIVEHNIIGPLVCHAGDGNFHALLLFKNDDELKVVEGLVHRMVERAQKLDGTATGEHGVGIGKKEYLEGELGAGTVDLLRSIKRTIDPQNIMNPGKLIPDRSAPSHH